jgi:hypothetical protein
MPPACDATVSVHSAVKSAADREVPSCRSCHVPTSLDGDTQRAPFDSARVRACVGRSERVWRIRQDKKRIDLPCRRESFIGTEELSLSQLGV